MCMCDGSDSGSSFQHSTAILFFKKRLWGPGSLSTAQLPWMSLPSVSSALEDMLSEFTASEY